MLKRKKRRQKNHRTQPADIMTLEQRAMLTAVSVSVVNDTVLITGSAGDDNIEITQDGDTVTITGVDGTTINGSTDAFVIPSGSDLNYSARLGNGDDSIQLDGINTSGSVFVSGARGDDAISVANSEVDGFFGLFGGSGNDQFELTDTDLSNRVVFGGSGSDQLTLDGENQVQGRERTFSVEEVVDNTETEQEDKTIAVDFTDGNLTITGTNNDDGIIIVGRPGGIQLILSRVTGNTFEDGSTRKFIPVADGELTSLNINLGDGNDGIFISGVDAPNTTLNVFGGSGFDVARLRRSNFLATNLDGVER